MINAQTHYFFLDLERTSTHNAMYIKTMDPYRTKTTPSCRKIYQVQCTINISDKTFCTQSQHKGGNSSRIFGRISLPSSGDGN